MDSASVRALLEAYAFGDAMGMPTEFMTPSEIRALGPFDSFLPSACSKNHPELPPGSVTDDTEQNVWLLRRYVKDGSVTLDGSVEALLEWIAETRADEKKYIGPSTLRALNAIREGEDIAMAGRGGRSCGGIMRSIAPALCSPSGSILPSNIRTALLATHNTSLALSAAVSYARALWRAAEGGTLDDVLSAALMGADEGAALSDERRDGDSIRRKLEEVFSRVPSIKDDESLIDYLYDEVGTGLPSDETASSVFAVFLHTHGDPFRAALLSSRLGGDTDTIAALSAALSAAYRGTHNIPGELVSTLERVNGIDFEELSKSVAEVFHS